MMGQKTDQSFDMKVDQQKKTLQSKTGEGEKVKYKVSGDVFTFDLSGERVQVMRPLWKCSKTLNSNVQNNTREGQRGSALFLL